MITAVILFLVVVASVFYLIHPLGRRLPWTFGKGMGMMRLKERKEAALLAIHDIDFEYAAGRLSPEEYKRLREAFKREAISAMKDIDMDLEPPRRVSRELHEAVKREVLRLKREMALLAFFLFLFLSPARLLAYEVTVKVNNGTLKAPEEGASVTLYILERDKEAHKVKEKLKGVTDSGGTVTFQTPEGKGLFAMPLVEYRGVTYRGKGIELSGRKKEIAVDVYELSDEDGLVEIKERNVFIGEVKGGTLGVVDVVTISNRGDKTYVGRFNDSLKMNETVRIGLPYGYERPTLDGPVDVNEVVTMTDGLVLQEAIPPGEKTLWLTYKLRSEIGRFDLKFPVEIPYGLFRFYFPKDAGWRVKVEGLEEAGEVKMKDRTFLRWEGEGIGRGVKVILLDPTRYKLIGRNEIAISLALISSIAAGLLYIRKRRHEGYDEGLKEMERERAYLSSLIGRLGREIRGDKEMEGFYRPYIEVLSKRVEELELVINHSRKAGISS